jgi:hypothetical protein
MGYMPMASGGYGGSPAPDVPPPTNAWFQLCADWTTHFVDENAGDYGTGEGSQSIDAAYAKVAVRRVTSSIPGCTMDTCTTPVWTGFLDIDGCRKLNLVENEKYVVKVWTELERWTVTGTFTSKIDYYDASKTNLGPKLLVKSFQTPTNGPGNEFANLALPYHRTANVAGTISRLFKTDEVVPATYNVKANLGCNNGNGYPDDGIPPTDSCAGLTSSNIGPREIPGTDRPGNIAWKSVIAHELGHAVQLNSFGIVTATGPGQGYGWPDGPDADSLPDPDPPGFDALGCGCSHVVALNQLHCIQSVERFGKGNAEGFAHFLASKIWNNPADTDCFYNYYKDFNPDTGPNRSPPNKVNCKTAVKWRDSHCFDPDASTEYDWMQFFWNVNTQSSSKSTLAQLGSIFTTACGGVSCNGVGSINWENFRLSAKSFYGQTDPRYLHLINTANVMGVDQDL